MQYHQGRLLDHVHLTVRNFGRARDFYVAIFAALGKQRMVHEGRDWIEIDELYIDTISDDRQLSHVHLCFQASSRRMVQDFHAAGLEHGGKDNGPPGMRDYHPGYFAAFLLDPDGNNIEAKLDERIGERSARSVTSSYSR